MHSRSDGFDHTGGLVPCTYQQLRGRKSREFNATQHHAVDTNVLESVPRMHGIWASLSWPWSAPTSVAQSAFQSILIRTCSEVHNFQSLSESAAPLNSQSFHWLLAFLYQEKIKRRDLPRPPSAARRRRHGRQGPRSAPSRQQLCT